MKIMGLPLSLKAGLPINFTGSLLMTGTNPNKGKSVEENHPLEFLKFFFFFLVFEFHWFCFYYLLQHGEAWNSDDIWFKSVNYWQQKISQLVGNLACNHVPYRDGSLGMPLIPCEWTIIPTLWASSSHSCGSVGSKLPRAGYPKSVRELLLIEG